MSPSRCWAVVKETLKSALESLSCEDAQGKVQPIRCDPETGAILRTLTSDRFVTGVTWVDGELWHGTWEGDQSDLRHVDPATGDVIERIEMPAGMGVSGLESDGGDRFYCGGGESGKVRAVRRKRAGAEAKGANAGA